MYLRKINEKAFEILVVRFVDDNIRVTIPLAFQNYRIIRLVIDGDK